MPTFNWAESPGTSLTLKPRVVSSMFGDGYEQSADDGLNPVQQVWSVVITNAAEEEADEIEAFIKPGLGRARFDWTPPRQTVALKWKCTAYTRTLNEQFGEHDLRLTFEQVFEP